MHHSHITHYQYSAPHQRLLVLPYLQRDASVGFGQWGHSVLPLCVTGEGDQVMVAVAVGDQCRRATCLEQVQ